MVISVGIWLPELMGVALLGVIIPSIIYPLSRKFLNLSITDSASFQPIMALLVRGHFL
jgi:preprotein translocase subunit SecB